MEDSTSSTSLTEFQLWMLRDALTHRAIYFAGPEEGQFPVPGPKGYPLTKYARGEKKILRNLVAKELMEEESFGVFVLTEAGQQVASQASGSYL